MNIIDTNLMKECVAEIRDFFKIGNYKVIQLHYLGVNNYFCSELKSQYLLVNKYLSPYFTTSDHPILKTGNNEVMVCSGKLSNFPNLQNILNFPENIKNSTTYNINENCSDAWEYCCRFDNTKMIYKFDDKVVYILDKDFNTVYILSDAKYYLEKEVRAAIENIQIFAVETHTNSVFVRASGFALGCYTFLFIGSKGSGRTTLLLEGIINWHVKELTRNRVFLFCENGMIIARGWPSMCHIALGTMNRFNITKRALADYHSYLVSHPYIEGSKDVKLHFKDNDLFPNLKIIPQGIVDFIVMPRITDSVKKVSIYRPGREEIGNYLSKNICATNDPSFINWHEMSKQRTRDRENHTKILINSIINRPVYFMKWNPECIDPLQYLYDYIS
jgi:hypothetical protein